MRRIRTRLRAGGASAAAAMPSGALGIWYASDYDSGANAVPNSTLTTAPIANIFRGGSLVLSNTELWSWVGATITDAASGDYSRVNGASGWYGGSSKSGVTLPAGTYTVASTVQRNGASNQSFAFTGDNTATRSAVKTATATPQRFSYTFTRASDFGIGTVMLCSSDGSTAADLLVKDYELFAGSSDLGPVGTDGNLYLGHAKTSTSPSVSTNVIDLTGQGFGLIQLPSAHTVTNVTAMAVVSKTAAGSSYQSFLSKIEGYSDFSAMTELGGKPYTFLGGSNEFNKFSGMWNLLNQGYHMISVRYDGTARSVWLDDIKLFSADASISSYSLRDFFVGIVNATALYSGLKVNSIALYDSALSDTEIRTAYSVLSSNATTDGLTMATARVLVAEGDSITEGATDATYPYLYGANANPKFLGVATAVSGSTIATMQTRAAAVDAILPTTPGSRKFILSVLIGRNDLVSLGTSTWLTNLAAYLDARRAAGWTVVLGTLLPSTGVGFNTARGTANTELRLWASNGSTVPGKHADYICDFAADATMGPDAAASDTTYYSDGTHPTAAGQAILETVYRAVVDAI